jgi:Ankyrin repeats (3 copies)
MAANTRSQAGAPQKVPGRFDFFADGSDAEDAAPVEASPRGTHQSGKFGTTLQAASEVGNAEIMNLLLDNAAEVGDTDEHRQSSIHQAAHEGHEAVVGFLLDQGGDVN